MDRIKNITFKGKEMLYLDFSNLKTEAEIETIINTASKLIRSKPAHSMLIMSNYKDTFFNRSILSTFSEFASGNQQHVGASVAFGLSGISRIAFDGVIRLTRRNMKVVSTQLEAQEYLAAEAEK